MTLKGIRIDIKNDGQTRVKLTKRLPNGNTFVRYTSQSDQQEFCEGLEQFTTDYENKVKQLTNN